MPCVGRDVSEVNVLVPGAGLGRLAWEIARLGYACQGNEWSFFMLFSSHFVLNRYAFTNCDQEIINLIMNLIFFFTIFIRQTWVVVLSKV